MAGVAQGESAADAAGLMPAFDGKITSTPPSPSGKKVGDKERSHTNSHFCFERAIRPKKQNLPMKSLGNSSFSERPMYSVVVNNYQEIAELTLPSKRSIVLIAGDSRDVSSSTIAAAAESLLESGLTTVCTWGPDCERVHDVFDEVYVGDASHDPSFILMSTWHSSDTLAEAVHFFRDIAFPDDHDFDETSYIAITVANAPLAGQIESILLQPATDEPEPDQ